MVDHTLYANSVKKIKRWNEKNWEIEQIVNYQRVLSQVSRRAMAIGDLANCLKAIAESYWVRQRYLPHPIFSVARKNCVNSLEIFIFIIRMLRQIKMKHICDLKTYNTRT